MLYSIKQICKNFLLIILAIILFIITSIVAFIWLLIVSFTSIDRNPKNIVYGLAAYFLAIAESLDKFGNCAFGGFFNSLFLKFVAYSFGYNHETISQVIGWNFLFKSLHQRGELLYSTLNKIETDHCELAVVSGIVAAKLKLEKFEELKSVNPHGYDLINKMVDKKLQNKDQIRIDINKKY